MRFAVLLSLFAVTVSAQVKESITVNVIEVPVTVVDGSGNPVRGLSAKNFKLYDQGKEVAISGFDAIDFASKEAVSAVAQVNPAARRKFFLLFDLSFSNPKSLLRAQEAARAFVAKAVQPRDLVGVGTIDKSGFHLVAAFTTDRELVTDAIGQPGDMRVTNDPLHIARLGNNVKVESAGGGRMGGVVNSEWQAIIEHGRKLHEQTVRAEVEKEMDYLGDLARMLRGVPGRKQLVFLSEGFDGRLVQGSDAREDLNYVPTYTSAPTDTERRWGTNSSSATLRRMAEEFRGSDVVLHAIDIQGVRVENRVDNSSDSTFVNTAEALNLMAEPTGGMVFKNVNKIETDFARLMRTQEVVYVLSFQAPAVKPGRFHDLKVKLVDVPGRANAFARAGYYEGGDAQPDRALTNAEIITNDIEQKDLRSASVAAAFPTSGAEAQVPVIVEVNGDDLLKDVKENKVAFEIYVYAFDQDGAVRDRLYQQIGLDLAKAQAKLRANGLKYYATLALPPGKYVIKSLVTIPNSTRRGFSRAEVVVPSADQLAAAPLFVEESSDWVLIKGTSHDTTGAAYPFDLGGERFIPAATARTKRFAIIVPNASPEDVTVDAAAGVKFIGATKGVGGTALVMEVQKPATTAEVTVHRKGTPVAAIVPLHFVQ